MDYQKILFIFLILYALVIILTFSMTTIGADEGTHLILSLFYHDLSKFIIDNGISSISKVYDYGIDYLVNYPKLTIYYPPLYHFIVGIGFYITISEYVGKFVTLLFSIGTIFLTFKIGKFLFNEKIGFISALLLAFSPIIVSHSAYVLVDIPVFFFSMLTLWFYLNAFKTNKKIYYILGAISLSAGFLTKWFILPIIPALLFYLIIEKKYRKLIKNFLMSLLLVLVVLTPYLIFVYKFDIIQLMLIGPIRAGYAVEHDPQFYTIQGWLWYPITLMKQLSLPIGLASLATLFLFIIKKMENWKFLLIWFLSFYIIFTIIPNKDPRYILSYLPVFLFSFAYFFEKLIFKNKYWITLLVCFIVAETFIAFYFLPRYHYPVDEIAETVYQNSKGNVAMVSEGDIYSSAFMFHLAKLDRNRTIIVYRPCVFFNITEEQMDNFLKENNIYYLILVEDGYGTENFGKIKNVTLEREFYKAKLYRYDGFDGKGLKKCNYVCLTQEEICLRDI